MIGGLVATVPMTALMEAGHRRLPPQERYPLEPRLIVEHAGEALAPAEALGERRLRRVTLASHLGYGAAAGSLYPLARGLPLPTVARGAAYGLGVWAAGYLGWLPAVGLLAPATRHPPRRVALNVASHLLWGAVTAAVAEALAPRPGRRRSAGRDGAAAREV